MKLGSARAQGFFWVVVTAIGWGLNWPAMKFALTEWQPFTFRVVTGAGSVVLLFAVALARGETVIPRGGQWGRLALAGVLNITSFVGLGTLSLRWLDAAEAATVAYTMPIWAAALAWPILGERPTAPRITGLAIGLAGVGVLLGPSLSATGGALAAKLPGFACILGTSILFALGAVLTKRNPPGMKPLASLAWQIVFGTIPIAAGALAFDHWDDLARVGPTGWLITVYVVVIATCVSYLAWFRALRLLPASTATIGTLLVPIIGVFSAALLLHEPLGPRELLALGATVLGVVLASRG